MKIESATLEAGNPDNVDDMVAPQIGDCLKGSDVDNNEFAIATLDDETFLPGTSGCRSQ